MLDAGTGKKSIFTQNSESVVDGYDHDLTVPRQNAAIVSVARPDVERIVSVNEHQHGQQRCTSWHVRRLSDPWKQRNERLSFERSQSNDAIVFIFYSSRNWQKQ